MCACVRVQTHLFAIKCCDFTWRYCCCGGCCTIPRQFPSFVVFSFARPTVRPPLSISVPSALCSIRRHPSTLCRLRAQWAVNRFYPLKFTQLRKSWYFLYLLHAVVVRMFSFPPSFDSSLLNGGHGEEEGWCKLPFHSQFSIVPFPVLFLHFVLALSPMHA